MLDWTGLGDGTVQSREGGILAGIRTNLEIRRQRQDTPP